MSFVSLEGGPRFFPVPHFRSKPDNHIKSPDGITQVQRVALHSLSEGSILSMFYANGPRSEYQQKCMTLTVLDVQRDEDGPMVRFNGESIYESVKHAFWGVDGRQFELPDRPEVILRSVGSIVVGESCWFRLEDETPVVVRNVNALYLRDRGH